VVERDGEEGRGMGESRRTVGMPYRRLELHFRRQVGVFRRKREARAEETTYVHTCTSAYTFLCCPPPQPTLHFTAPRGPADDLSMLLLFFKLVLLPIQLLRVPP